MDEAVLVITCEHAGNQIPEAYRTLFKPYRNLLNSHRGYDAGAYDYACKIAEHFNVPLFAANTSRLLIDQNRSLGHPHLFSKITAPLPDKEKKHIIDFYYMPHRAAVRDAVSRFLDPPNTVVHIAVHSFTPILNGKLRTMDIGFLYDPKRTSEKLFCQYWRKAVLSLSPDLKIRFNAPYRGTSDGLTTFFRKRFPFRYLGIELEINQRHLTKTNPVWDDYGHAILSGLQSSLHRLRDSLIQ